VPPLRPRVRQLQVLQLYSMNLWQQLMDKISTLLGLSVSWAPGTRHRPLPCRPARIQHPIHCGQQLSIFLLAQVSSTNLSRREQTAVLLGRVIPTEAIPCPLDALEQQRPLQPPGDEGFSASLFCCRYSKIRTTILSITTSVNLSSTWLWEKIGRPAEDTSRMELPIGRGFLLSRQPSCSHSLLTHLERLFARLGMFPVFLGGYEISISIMIQTWRSEKVILSESSGPEGCHATAPERRQSRQKWQVALARQSPKHTSPRGPGGQHKVTIGLIRLPTSKSLLLSITASRCSDSWTPA
jgi:hypothetical protein